MAWEAVKLYGPKVANKVSQWATSAAFGYEISEMGKDDETHTKVVEKIVIEKQQARESSQNSFITVVCLVILLIILIGSKILMDYRKEKVERRKRIQEIPLREVPHGSRSA